MKRQIEFYRTEKGKCPIEEFLDSLPAKAAQKVAWVLEIIEELPIVPTSYFKKLVNTNLWECRIQSGTDIYRLLCFMKGNSVVVLTHGFIKKTQKTPPVEIEKAEKLRLDYLKRVNK